METGEQHFQETWKDKLSFQSEGHRKSALKVSEPQMLCQGIHWRVQVAQPKAAKG